MQPFRAAGAAVIAAGVLCASSAHGQSQSQPQTAPPATIRGHVVAADSGQPLRKAQVRAMSNEPIGPGTRGIVEPRSTISDADGAYEFTSLPPGRYTLTAFKNAYVNQTFGQAQAVTPPKPLELRAGEVAEHIDFILQRGAVVTGRIFDEFGEPMPFVNVAAVQTRIVNGKRELQPMNTAPTDDLGEFRIFGLMPGQYYVKATWRRMGAPQDPASPDRTGYPDTFFPGTVNVDEAQRFTLRAGQTVADLAMALSPVKTARVEGTVVDGNGRPFVVPSLYVTRIDGNFGSGAPVRPDGTFVIPNLTPGEYVLRAQQMPPRKEVATLKLTVGTEDIADVRLVAVPPSTVTGRVIVDPAQAQALPAPLMLLLMPVDADYRFMGGGPPTRVADDMSFELSVSAGRHRINWMNLPPGWMIRAIRIHNVDVTDDDLEVKSGEDLTGVDIELTNRSGTVSGRVSDGGGGSAAKESTVILFAADSKRWIPGSRYVRIARADQEGRFKMTGLAPAAYNIVAVDKLETPGQWSDPEFLQRIAAKAESVTVMEGETRTIDLRLTTGS